MGCCGCCPRLPPAAPAAGGALPPRCCEYPAGAAESRLRSCSQVRRSIKMIHDTPPIGLAKLKWMASRTLLTIDDFERLPDDVAKNKELVDGELVDVPG